MAKLIALLIGVTSVQAFGVGNGGMPECVSLSVQAALDKHSETHSLRTIPSLVVRESNGSPSNGIDVMVTIDDKIIYYVIASPNVDRNAAEAPTHLKGCLSASVGYSQPVASPSGCEMALDSKK